MVAISQTIFLDEDCCIVIQISLKLVFDDAINNNIVGLATGWA